MGFENKPGQFALFKNDEKTEDNHPDYKGSGVDLNGTEIWVAAWIKKSKSGQTYMSCNIQPKQPRKTKQEKPKNEIEKQFDALDDDIPF